MELSILLLAGSAIVVATVIQATMGIGLSLIAAPAVVLLDPSLVPGSLLVLGLLLPMMSVAHEWRHIAWRDAGWLVGARGLTTPLGVLVVGWLSADAIGIAVGVGVIAAVGLSLWRLDVRPTSRNLAIAGAVAGVSGTAASIGGPPAAVVLQHQQGPRLRATLAAFFVAGAAMSLTGLAIGGRLTRHQLLYGASWIPCLAVGFLVAIPLRRYVRGAWLRYAILGLSAASSVVVIVRSLG